MKKWIALVLTLCLAVGFAGCSKKTEPAPGNVPGTTEEIIEKIYAAHAAMELPLLTMPLDLSDNNTLEYNTGLTSTEGVQEVSVSEPMMGQPYSLVLVRCTDETTASKVAKTMLDNVDMRKWICVMADTKTAGYTGDLAWFFMVNSEFDDQATVESMQKAVETVCGSTTIVG